MTLTVFRGTGHLLCWILPVRISQMCFSWLAWGCRFGGGKPQRKVHSHHIISRVHTINMMYHCKYWFWSPGCGNIVRFLHRNITHSPPFHTVLFGRVPMRNREVCNYLEARVFIWIIWIFFLHGKCAFHGECPWKLGSAVSFINIFT